MSSKHIMPKSTLGKWGLWVLVAAALLVVSTAILALSTQDSRIPQAQNLLWVMGPLFIALSLAGIVISWIAVFKKKDHAIFLIIFAAIYTALSVFIFVGEVLEAIMMNN